MRFPGVAVAVGALLYTCAPALAASVSVPPLLASEIASARHSGLQVLIPSTINPYGVRHLYGSGGATGRGYTIDLGAAPNCDDATACFVADFIGGHGKLSFADHVSLVKGITGAFHPSTCGASCAPASIEWREFGALYTVQYMGGRSSLVSLADSAISAGPR